MGYLDIEYFELVVAFCYFGGHLTAEDVEGGTIALQFPPEVSTWLKGYLLYLVWGQLSTEAKLAVVCPKIRSSRRENPSETSLAGSSS